MLHKVGLRPDDKDAGTVLLLLCPLDVAQQRRAVAVDGQVIFTSDEPLELGSFVKVKITGAKSYDVYGTCVSE